MKKNFTIFVVLLLNTFLFAREVNSYVTAAYNYGLFTEKGDGVKTKIACNGLDLSISCYLNENWGFYINTDYNFPTEVTVISGGSTIIVTDSDWDFSMLISAIIGPTYKYKINEKFEMFGAAGFHIAQYVLKSKFTSTQNRSFGIAGDIGIRYLPTNHLYINGGCLLSHDFKCKGEVYTYGTTTIISGSYNFSSIRPYIGIGFSFSEVIK